MKTDATLTGGRLFTDVERLRLLSVLCVAIASGLTAMWALRLLASRLLAGLAGALVALGSVPAIYAEQLRAYALVMLLAVTFGLLLVRVASRPDVWSWWALALCAWIGGMTHYFFFLLVAAGAVWLWAVRPRPPRAGKATLALGLGLLGFLAWIPSFLNQHGNGRYRWIGGFDAASVAGLPGSLFFGPAGPFYGLARIAVTLAFVVGAVVLWRRPGGSAVVVLALLPIAGAALVWAVGQPVFTQRNMLPVAPFIAIVVAGAPSALPRRFVAPVAVTGVAVVVAGAAVSHATLGRIEYDRVASALVDEGWTVDDPIRMDLLGTEISAIAWYLPEHPTLARAPRAERECATRYVVEHSSTLGLSLASHPIRVDALRELKSYDHPSWGRQNGRIAVARLRKPLESPGALYYVQGRPIPCLREGS